MKLRFNSKWLVVACVVAALLLGAWIGMRLSAATITEADWIEAIQSADAN